MVLLSPISLYITTVVGGSNKSQCIRQTKVVLEGRYYKIEKLLLLEIYSYDKHFRFSFCYSTSILYFSFSVTYWEGSSILVGERQYAETKCEFDREERITDVTVHHDGMNLVGLEFKTSLNTKCSGRIGLSPNITHTSGHQLLYFSGLWGIPAMRSFYLHFDYQCSLK